MPRKRPSRIATMSGLTVFCRNLRRAKEETRKLEHEGKKMEERLMELKLAMGREKEERE